MKRPALLVILLLAGCASMPSNENRADVHCTRQLATAIVLADRVHIVDGGCIEWTVGPTHREREAFERRKAAREGSR